MGWTWHRWLVLAISASCYAIALPLPAYYEGAPALGGCQAFYGLECLLLPLTSHPMVVFIPFSWWANPLFSLGLFFLCRGESGPAFGCGFLAIGAALLF